MRSQPSLALWAAVLIVGACGPDATAPSGGGLTSVPAVVVDSVTYRRLASVPVQVGTAVAVTTQEGTFMFPSSAGSDTVRIATGGYEPFTAILPAGVQYHEGDTVRFGLRRIGPFATRCILTDRGLQASIVDLQGRVPDSQMAASSLWFIDSLGNYTVPGTLWIRQVTDPAEWQVEIHGDWKEPILAFWTLHDSAGTQFSDRCQIGNVR